MSKMIKPTKEQFEDYVSIRDSGMTNMFDINRVCELSDTDITKEHCMYIMDNFEELAKEYEVDI